MVIAAKQRRFLTFLGHTANKYAEVVVSWYLISRGSKRYSMMGWLERGATSIEARRGLRWWSIYVPRAVWQMALVAVSLCTCG